MSSVRRKPSFSSFPSESTDDCSMPTAILGYDIEDRGCKHNLYGYNIRHNKILLQLYDRSLQSGRTLGMIPIETRINWTHTHKQI